MKFIIAAILYFTFFSNINSNNAFDKKNEIEKIEFLHFADGNDPDYSQIFKYEYPAALEMLKQNAKLFHNTCSLYKIDIIAI